MSRESCLVCNFHGRVCHEVSPNYIYQTNNIHTILLCYHHSVEFFKLGQTNFLIKYKKGFDLHGLDLRYATPRKDSFAFTSFR